VWDLNEIRLESFRQALREAGRPNDALASRLTRVYFEHRDAGRRAFADALPALSKLRGTYRLGVLSNGNTPPEDLGLGGMFDFTVLARDHGGAEKPDLRIFEIALDSAGCAAHELVHVGDSPENDVAGARAAGVGSVWLNRDRQERDTDVEPDWEIRSLGELEEILCPGA
jgi:HAD superfamily hydrolase (TIGR01509 family)